MHICFQAFITQRLSIKFHSWIEKEYTRYIFCSLKLQQFQIQIRAREIYTTESAASSTLIQFPSRVALLDLQGKICHDKVNQNSSRKEKPYANHAHIE